MPNLSISWFLNQLNKMYKKIIPAIFIIIALFCSFNGDSFGLEEPLDKISVELLPPMRPHARLPKERVDMRPVVVSGVIPVEIGKTVNEKDVQNQRYLVEYFIDGDLVYETDGSDILGSGGSSFIWHFDSTGYSNGSHKLVVNFWDKEGPSAIGIVNIIIKNPISIEQLKKVSDSD